MPNYYCDIKDGHRLADPPGLNFRDDDDAIGRQKGGRELVDQARSMGV